MNLVELYPLLPQHDLVEFCHSNGILVMARQPLGGEPVANIRDGHGAVSLPLDYLTIAHVAWKSCVTRAHVCITLASYRDMPVVPRTVSQSRMIENSTIASFPEELFQQMNEVDLEIRQVRSTNGTAKVGFDISTRLRMNYREQRKETADPGDSPSEKGYRFPKVHESVSKRYCPLHA